ncbi:hypothetical protein Vadar_001085 [Vaccinium darrowii]|uniref:Uncharacterized protein n=1 Tax=Vaccinium darrowii TaxID=229202 RepID=A0ACB7XEP4_9ERIC|nr:hypothetical protein Vadar_001085 [Vaccinium darrowii]
MARTMAGCKVSSAAADAPKKKRMGKGKKLTSGVGVRKKQRVMGNDCSILRKKIKENADEAAQTKWEASFTNRTFVCERQVCKRTLAKKAYIQTITELGLSHFFIEVDGYHGEWVVEFYTHMKIDLESKVIASKVDGKKVRVTPESIASYLGYKRPTAPHTFPLPERDFSEYELKKELYDHPDDSTAIGNLKEAYWTAHTIIHYNLYPRGKEKVLGLEEMELLKVFMNPAAETVDYAEWIFFQLVYYKNHGTIRLKMPFPSMITALCKKAGVKKTDDMALTPGIPGPINHATESKSRSSSSRHRRHVEEAPRKGKGFKPKMKEAMNQIWPRQTDILDEQRRFRKMMEVLVHRKEDKCGIVYDSDTHPEPSSGGGLDFDWGSSSEEDETDDDDDNAEDGVDTMNTQQAMHRALTLENEDTYFVDNEAWLTAVREGYLKDPQYIDLATITKVECGNFAPIPLDPTGCIRANCLFKECDEKVFPGLLKAGSCVILKEVIVWRTSNSPYFNITTPNIVCVIENSILV